jgi:hypothetical protein
MITNSIRFFSNEPSVEVLRLSKDGIWANPDIPADDAAKLVLEAIDDNIKILVQKAVLAEREACAEVCKKHADVYAGLEQNPTTQSAWAACIDNRDAIRARGQA